MSEHPTFDICVEPIELFKLLKIANMVGGGEAKTMISEGNVLVNNNVVVQKRKKIRHGDIIEYNGNIIEIAYNPAKKSAEFINTVVLASKKEQRKKRAKSKARALSSETNTTP
ncbi:RNA-binding S4 domain-containing protein [Colwellia sp. 4_MG-2023]|uniref:RNA-binding S4 domain-containing protein n=1 Tax=unclassified Colwellia TaxID=196834 RepID=UPI001C099144|nr:MULTISPECIES: RNA-binding S4 domain-containing protein [unclassified Colwellia]MBU2923605.1 RNA-binding S4 domain-containing protein [Colwellia sp. C2M11]MDO6505873.1 RNA-binding S4 domain-containing protein [Colwellia sp. 5_MG-2023]MDO6554554.1 RNA-binding S4 domain-containing protein [Colwellia sp. 4_MG-2023]MDO6652296.1 RNA-binding S4 domain-containing protein [Colwellia sp. 3_MG-2023]MDO6664535.1 RNA-binding S4 domain-containing protein [Colwellia sp. 2_MG-2023]